MPLNYEMIYKMRQHQERIWQKRRAVTQADADVKTAELTFRSECAKNSGIQESDLHFSSEHCRAEGIAHHVYHIRVRGAPNGSTENKCIFCGCDNFDDGVS